MDLVSSHRICVFIHQMKVVRTNQLLLGWLEFIAYSDLIFNFLRLKIFPTIGRANLSADFQIFCPRPWLAVPKILDSNLQHLSSSFFSYINWGVLNQMPQVGLSLKTWDETIRTKIWPNNRHRGSRFRI